MDFMDFELVTKKILQQSDVETHQNRFLIPITDVRERLLHLLSLDEQRDANLLFLMTKRRKKDGKESFDTNGDERRRKQMEVGRRHGGLGVRLIAGNQEIGMTLTQWDKTLSVVLKGGDEWKTVVSKQELRKGDYVELLAKRRSATEVEKQGETAQLCFLLRKKGYSRVDNTATAEPILEATKVTNIGCRAEQLDLSISLISLPAHSALQNNPNSAPKNSIARTVVKWEEKLCEENNLNIELMLRQPGSMHDLS